MLYGLYLSGFPNGLVMFYWVLCSEALFELFTDPFNRNLASKQLLDLNLMPWYI